jgi:MFS superfamily sulfate permease-like transporter
MTAIIQTILNFRDILFGILVGILTIFFIRRDQKNEIKNQQLQARVEEIGRTRKAKNDFNNLSDAEQSEWMLDDLKEKRSKFDK